MSGAWPLEEWGGRDWNFLVLFLGCSCFSGSSEPKECEWIVGSVSVIRSEAARNLYLKFCGLFPAKRCLTCLPGNPLPSPLSLPKLPAFALKACRHRQRLGTSWREVHGWMPPPEAPYPVSPWGWRKLGFHTLPDPSRNRVLRPMS